MSHEISKVEHVPLGDTKVLPFSVTEDGSALNLSGAEIEWSIRLDRGDDAALSLDDSGVSIDRDDSDGEFEITLAESATSSLSERVYRERVEITDNEGNRTTWRGQIQFVSDT